MVKEVTVTHSIKIEDAVPLPNSWQFRRDVASKWAFVSDMQEGQSFLLKKSECDVKQAAEAIRQYAYERGFKIAARKQPDGDVRVWRLGAKQKVVKTVQTSGSF